MHVSRKIASVAVAAIAVLGVSTGALAASTVVVRESSIARQAENTLPTKNWVFYFRTAASTGVFRTGPATPPLGTGSFELSTPTGSDKGTLFNYDYAGKPLSSVNALAYSTYRSAGNDQQVASLNVEVDVNGAAPGGVTTLVFEPVYNTSQGAVVSNQWQTWDAYNGGNAIWWSSNPIPAAPNRDTFVSWNTIVAANPDAVIVGGIGINQGSGNPALVTAVDALTVGAGGTTTTYDFEPNLTQPANKDACKKGGWENLGRADNTTFKNQGDCIQYANTGK
jgi:hypothetical protein